MCIRDRANAEGTAFDYYYANQAQSEGQIIAENITVLDDEDHKRVSQFEINDDFTRAVYIQGYDVANESGGLYTVAINNGAVGSDRKISDTAYSCNITPDGLTIRYADSYDITWNLVKMCIRDRRKRARLKPIMFSSAYRVFWRIHHTGQTARP